MYKNILVPVDGSTASMQGLSEAIELCKVHGSTLRLIHVVDELVMINAEPVVYFENLIEALHKAGREILNQAEAFAQERKVSVESTLVTSIGGRAADRIIEQAQQWPADLIAMGTHGRRGLRRLGLGSDAEIVLRNTPVPVLLVRSRECALHSTKVGATGTLLGDGQ